MEKLRVVEPLQKHARDLAREGTLGRDDEGVEALAEELLLLLRRGVDEDRGQLLLGESARHHRHLLRHGRRTAGRTLRTHGGSLLVAVAHVGRKLDLLLACGAAAARRGNTARTRGAPGAAAKVAALLGRTHGTHAGARDEAAATGAHTGVGEHEELPAGLRASSVHERAHLLRRVARHVLALLELALDALALEVGAADLLGLVERDVDRLLADHLAVHVRDGAGGVVSRREAHVAEALGLAALLLLDLGRGDRAEGGEVRAELVVLDGVIQVLDVEVGARVLLHQLSLALRPLAAEFRLTLGTLLGLADIDGLLPAERRGVVERLGGLGGGLKLLEVDKTEALGLALGVGDDDSGGDLAILGKLGLELLLGDVLGKVLDEDVRELGHATLVLALHGGNERADVHTLVGDDVAVHLLDGGVGLLLGLILDEAVAL
mmetsp:Transcript_20918/g.49614  ORF Transcript_20918/g.49614 Transcript_20918/m.49614 type:complete len:435 (+) Transcript_20918:452-1756(+)